MTARAAWTLAETTFILWLGNLCGLLLTTAYEMSYVTKTAAGLPQLSKTIGGIQGVWVAPGAS